MAHAASLLLALGAIAWSARALVGQADSSRASVARDLTRADLEAWLDGFMPYALQRADVAGAVVVVVKDAQVLLQKGYGYADAAARTPVDPERTMFRAGSVGKLFTWTAIMQLVEQGKLDLDRDINTYLDFKIPPRLGEPITLRNLMTHTPGFEEIAKNLMADDPRRFLALGPYLKTWTPDRVFPPGKVPAYSNYGVALAGYIVERVSGERYDDYIDRHIFAPLGMTSSTFRQPLPDRFAARMSKGYRLGSGQAHPYELVGPAPAGAIAASGGDMASFMIAHLQSGAYGSARILSPETARAMHETALPILPPLNSMLLGFYRRDLNGRRIIAHDGDTQFFHSGLSLFVDDGVGLYVSVNSTGKGGAAVPIRTALLEQFTDRYFPAPDDARKVDAKVAAEHARLMAGTYESSRGAYSSFLSLAGLLGQIKLGINDDGTLHVAALQSPSGQPKKWREVALLLWREVGGKDRLAARVENGKVAMFSIDEVSPYMVFQPVAWWKSSVWLVPLLLGSLGALLVTGIAWPIAAVARRCYRVAPGLTGYDARASKLIRIAAVVAIVTVVGWAGTLAPLAGNLFLFTSRLDPWISALHIVTLLVIVGTAAAALWNAWRAWTGTRGWFSKLWSAVVVAACVVVLWVAVAFNLIGFSTNY